MCECSPRAHLRGDPDGFHELAVAGAGAVGQPRVSADAVRALRDVSDRHCDQLLGDAWQGAIGENAPAELVERFVGCGGERSPAFAHRSGRLGVNLVRHGYSSLGPSVATRVDPWSGDGAVGWLMPRSPLEKAGCSSLRESSGG